MDDEARPGDNRGCRDGAGGDAGDDAGGTGPEAFRRLVEERGIAGLPFGHLIDLLDPVDPRDTGVAGIRAGGGAGRPGKAAEGAGGTRFDELVRATALPRRVVEAALAALGDDVGEGEGGHLRLRPGASGAYRALVPGRGIARDAAPAVPPWLLRRVTEAVEAAPRPNRNLDHVAATPGTVARRATYLTSAFALSGRRVLMVGDHDLTSVALAALDPTVEVAVADIDEDVLAHIWHQSRPAAGPSRVSCLFTDVRLGLPRRLRGWADLVVTDPPYTPEGIALFARRGLEALADHGTGRLVVAYGWGDQPGLGLKAQDALAELRLAYEAVLPAFNRYVGAQAIGSASNLYVLRPTAATRRAVARPERPARSGGRDRPGSAGGHDGRDGPGGSRRSGPVGGAGGAAGGAGGAARDTGGAGGAARDTGGAGGAGRPEGGPNVYTHGDQSLEGGDAVLTPGEAAALVDVAEGRPGRPTGGRGPGSGPGSGAGAGPGSRAGAAPGTGGGAGGGWAGPAGPVALAVGERWPDGFPPRVVPLAACLLPESPEASPLQHAEGPVVADLRHDPGPLLLRLLLVSRAPRLAVLVRNDHPDIATQAGQEALEALVGTTLSLRHRRSTPSPRLAIVEAAPVAPPTPGRRVAGTPAPGRPAAAGRPAPGTPAAGGRPGVAAGPGEAAARHVLARPHAKLANACREALIRSTAGARDRPLTKNEARALIAGGLPDVDLSGTLMDLPRAQLAALLPALAALAEP